MDDEKITERLEALIAKADQVLATHTPNPPNVIGFTTLDSGAFTEWRTQSLSFLSNLLGPDHVYVEGFRTKVEDGFKSEVSAGQGILRAVREDVALGYLAQVRALLAAELTADFLGMAVELREKGYKDPAAVLAGSVLEQHLRKLADKVGVGSIGSNGKPKKADTLNAELAKATYDKLEQKYVLAWLGLRNEAAHGNYGFYSTEQVALMIDGVRGFVTRHPA